MNQLQTSDPKFHQWLLVQGYIDEEGVLTIKMREAKALWHQQNISQKRATIEHSFISIAKSLWEIYKNQLWVELGFSNFEEFLYSPDADFSKSVGYGLKELGLYLEEGLITEEWALRVGTSKVRTLLPKLKEGENIEEWKAKAEMLTNLDLQDEVAGREIIRYSGTGPLTSLIEELHSREEFWSGNVTLHVKTV